MRGFGGRNERKVNATRKTLPALFVFWKGVWRLQKQTRERGKRHNSGTRPRVQPGLPLNPISWPGFKLPGVYALRPFYSSRPCALQGGGPLFHLVGGSGKSALLQGSFGEAILPGNGRRKLLADT